jgi:hypothetical protein
VRRTRSGAVALAALALTALSCCGRGANPLPSATPVGTPTPGVSDTATPTGSPFDTAAPSASGTDAGTPFRSDTASPAGSPVPCTGGIPLRVDHVDLDARRTTEVVTIVSDGKTLGYGTREQSQFSDPVLKGPDNSTLTDPATLQRVADLLATARDKVLLTRPDPPDSKISASRKPFSVPGTYVLYNASAVLTAQLVLQCGGQQQAWVFSAESNPSTGVVNCAVEPPKSNSLARVVHQNNC